MVHQRRENRLLGWVIWHDGRRYIAENAFPAAAVVELASTRLHRVKNGIRAIYGQLDGAQTPFWYEQWFTDLEPTRIDLDAACDPSLDRGAEIELLPVAPRRRLGPGQ